MIEAYFGMKCNPFKKGIDTKDTYEFADFKEMQARLTYLLKTRGIGLFTGSPRSWKNIRCKILFTRVK